MWPSTNPIPSGRTGRPSRNRCDPGYAISQKKRKLVEKVFGWAKLNSILLQVKVRGVKKVNWLFRLLATAANLLRLVKTDSGGVGEGRARFARAQQPRNEERNSKKNGRWTQKSGSESQEPRLADFSSLFSRAEWGLNVKGFSPWRCEGGADRAASTPSRRLFCYDGHLQKRHGALHQHVAGKHRCPTDCRLPRSRILQVTRVCADARSFACTHHTER